VIVTGSEGIRFAPAIRHCATETDDVTFATAAAADDDDDLSHR